MFKGSLNDLIRFEQFKNYFFHKFHVFFKAEILFLERDSGGDSKKGILYPSRNIFKSLGLAPIISRNPIFSVSLPFTFVLEVKTLFPEFQNIVHVSRTNR